jgi:cell division septum initiation protein DivIVA
VDAVQETLDQITTLVEGARSMPMSASCVVNRAELLALLEQLRGQLPEAFDQAQVVLGDKDAVVEEGRVEAARIVAEARRERSRLVSQTEVVQEAVAESERLLEESRASAEAMRLEVEDYVDAKLANFEIVLTKTLSAVERGRQKLSGRHELEALRDADLEVEPLPGA